MGGDKSIRSDQVARVKIVARGEGCGGGDVRKGVGCTYVVA